MESWPVRCVCTCATSEEQDDVAVAACPLIQTRTRGRSSLCDEVRCSTCDLLHVHIAGLGEVQWVCARCLEPDNDRPLGYQRSGRCSRCKKDRFFLVPVPG